MTIDLTEHEKRCLDEVKKILGPMSVGRIIGMALRQFRLTPAVTAVHAGTKQEIGIDLLNSYGPCSLDPNEEPNSSSSSPCEQSLMTTGPSNVR